MKIDKNWIKILFSDKLKQTNAFLSTINEILAVKSLDQSVNRWKNVNQLSKIDGLPIAVKANISCTDFYSSSYLADSKMLQNYSNPYDATVIKNLKDAGAILVGHTSMDEFGMGSFGLNTHDKQPVLQYESNLLAGGSSSGSAVSVQSGASFAALGTDTGGSVRLPAALCNILAFKPSYGQLSRYGVVEFSGSLDTVGVFGDSIDTIVSVYDVLRGTSTDENDSTHRTRSELEDNSLVEDLSKVRVGYLSEFFTEDQISFLETTAIENGISLKPINLKLSASDLLSILSSYYCISTSECSSNLSRYDGLKYGYSSRTSLSDNKTHFEEICKSRSDSFGSQVQHRIITGNFVLSSFMSQTIDIQCYTKANLIRHDVINIFKRIFNDIDVLYSPVLPSDFDVSSLKVNNDKMKGELNKSNDNDEEKRAEFKADEYLIDMYNVLYSLAGLPVVSVPLSSFPLQIISNFGKDKYLLSFCSKIKY